MMFTTPASIRLLGAALIGTIILIFALASHKESCGWNTAAAPTYECAQVAFEGVAK